MDSDGLIVRDRVEGEIVSDLVIQEMLHIFKNPEGSSCHTSTLELPYWTSGQHRECGLAQATTAALRKSIPTPKSRDRQLSLDLQHHYDLCAASKDSLSCRLPCPVIVAGTAHASLQRLHAPSSHRAPIAHAPRTRRKIAIALSVSFALHSLVGRNKGSEANTVGRGDEGYLSDLALSSTPLDHVEPRICP